MIALLAEIFFGASWFDVVIRVSGLLFLAAIIVAFYNIQVALFLLLLTIYFRNVEQRQ